MSDTIGSATPSRAGVVDELFRRLLAPLRHQSFVDRNEIGAVGKIETVAVRPMLMDAAPRIGPIVVDLAAENMAADTPHVLVTEFLQIVVAHADVVDVRHLEG